MDLFKRKIQHKNSRITIILDNEKLIDIAVVEIEKQYDIIEDYIKKNPGFLSALNPISIKKNSPRIIKKMSEGAKIADVGPMAGVAGTIAEFACKKIMDRCDVAIINNGGDIFLTTKKPINIGIFAGYNKIADKLAFRIQPTKTAVCSSSSKMGNSISLGNCDLVTVFSKKSYIADSVATAVCNKIKNIDDIDKALNWGITLKGVDGILAVKDNKIGLIGVLPQIIKNKDRLLKEKIAKDEIWILD